MMLEELQRRNCAQSTVKGYLRIVQDGSQAEIVGGGCISLLFEKDPVSQNHAGVECEARF